MADIGQWSGSAVSVFPTTSDAAPNGLFPTEDKNPSSIYGWASSTSTLTLPSSDLADGYLLLSMVEVEASHNNRNNVRTRINRVSGTGNFLTGLAAGYSRDNSEDRAYISQWSFIHNPSASSTYQFNWIRDTGAGTPAGACPRATFQVIPLYYADIGLYSCNSDETLSGTTPVQITGWTTELDGTNITRSTDTITVTGDNKRYLVLGECIQAISAGRTQRWYGFDFDGTFDDAAKTCCYMREANSQYGGGIFNRLLETATASRTIEMYGHRGYGVSAGQGGADSDGTITSSNGFQKIVVMELYDNAEVFSSTDETGAQELALAGPVDINVAETEEFSDSASFTYVTDATVNCEQDMDVLVFANVSHAREANSIGSGTRWTVHGEVTVDGVEDTDLFHGNYNRGNQSSTDTFGSSTNILAAISVTTGEDLGISNQELSGTEGGNGDIETQPGWVGFGLVNLDSLEEVVASGAAPPSLGLLGVGV